MTNPSSLSHEIASALEKRLKALAECESAEPDSSADDLPYITWGELREYGETARMALEALTQQGWQPISTAPPEAIIGGWWHPSGTWIWDRCRFHNGMFYAIGGGRPTHWLPLPSPPALPSSASEGT